MDFIVGSVGAHPLPYLEKRDTSSAEVVEVTVGAVGAILAIPPAVLAIIKLMDHIQRREQLLRGETFRLPNYSVAAAGSLEKQMKPIATREGA